jgi:hypothetical protein
MRPSRSQKTTGRSPRHFSRQSQPVLYLSFMFSKPSTIPPPSIPKRRRKNPLGPGNPTSSSREASAESKYAPPSLRPRVIRASVFDAYVVCFAVKRQFRRAKEEASIRTRTKVNGQGHNLVCEAGTASRRRGYQQLLEPRRGESLSLCHLPVWRGWARSKRRQTAATKVEQPVSAVFVCVIAARIFEIM